MKELFTFLFYFLLFGLLFIILTFFIYFLVSKYLFDDDLDPIFVWFIVIIELLIIFFIGMQIF